MINVLLADDEYLIRAKLKKYLKDSDFIINSIYEASNGVEALEIIENNSVDVVIVDIQMPLLTGIDFAKELRKKSYNTKLIFLTGFEKFEYAKQAIQYNAIEYLLKPVKKPELYNSIEKCITLIDSEKDKLFPSPKQLKHSFELLTKPENKAELLSKLDYYLDEIYKSKDIYALKLLLTSFLQVVPTITSKEDSDNSTIDIDYIVTNLLYSSDTLEDIRLYCHNYYNSLLDSSKLVYIPNSTKTILQIKEYLDNNYTLDTVTLEFLSNKFYINPCYLSSTFKKVTGDRLVEYITKKRITKAKKLLKIDTIKIVDIAEKIGYKDYYYFSKTFKKYVGVSPLKYRQSL